MQTCQAPRRSTKPTNNKAPAAKSKPRMGERHMRKGWRRARQPKPVDDKRPTSKGQGRADVERIHRG